MIIIRYDVVQARLEAIFNTNLVTRSELDAKCFIELRHLPEMVALEVLDKFCETQLPTIRNKTAFFLGIVKRFRSERGIKGNQHGGGGGGGGAAASVLARGPAGPFPGQPFITYPGGQTMPIGGFHGLGTGGAYGQNDYQAQLLLQQQQLQQQLQQQQQLAAYGGYGGSEGLLGGYQQPGSYAPY